MQVDHLAKTEFFGDMCLKKHPVAPATAVTGNVATTLLVVSKYVLLFGQLRISPVVDPPTFH